MTGPRFSDELDPAIMREATIVPHRREWASHTAPVETGHRSPEVCRLTGVTFRQLDYWARTDVLRPSIADAHGSGSVRRYSDADVAAAKAVRCLLDRGISLQQAARVVPLVREGDGCRWLVVGDEVVACAAGELERICREIGACTVLDLGDGEVVAETA